MVNRGFVSIFIIVVAFQNLRAELPLQVRADQALGELQKKIQANDYSGALPWLEKAVSLEKEGFKLPNGFGFYAGQVYVKNRLPEKAVPYLHEYLSATEEGRFFWDALQLYSVASPKQCLDFLEVYLANQSSNFYQQALDLHARVSQVVSVEKKRYEDSVKRVEKQREDDSMQAEKKLAVARKMRDDSLKAVEAERARVLAEKLEKQRVRFYPVFDLKTGFDFTWLDWKDPSWRYEEIPSQFPAPGIALGGAIGLHWGSRESWGIRLMASYDFTWMEFRGDLDSIGPTQPWVTDYKPLKYLQPNFRLEQSVYMQEIGLLLQLNKMDGGLSFWSDFRYAFSIAGERKIMWEYFNDVMDSQKDVKFKNPTSWAFGFGYNLPRSDFGFGFTLGYRLASDIYQPLDSRGDPSNALYQVGTDGGNSLRYNRIELGVTLGN